jgi:hypothetical protein
MTDDTLIERLADLEHQQWMHWAQALIATEPGLAAERVERWRASFVPYAALPDSLKDLDRAWARRVLTLLEPENKP